MGQYFDIVNFDKKAILTLPGIPAAKLRDYYSRKEYDHALANMLSGEWRGDTIILLGDYADFEDAPPAIRSALQLLRQKYGLSDCAQDWTADMAEERGLDDIGSLKIHGDPKDHVFRYVYNHKRQQFIDLHRYPRTNSGIASPFVLLLALGNGMGNGDYHGPDEDLVGSWVTSADTITVETSLLDGDFTEISPFF